MGEEDQVPAVVVPATENSAAHAKRPDGMPVGRPWPKGVSGNPGGRPKALQRLKAMLEPHVEEIAQLIIDQAKKGDQTMMREYLDRLVGKPTVGEPDEEGRQSGGLVLRWKREGEGE